MDFYVIKAFHLKFAIIKLNIGDNCISNVIMSNFILVLVRGTLHPKKHMYYLLNYLYQWFGHFKCNYKRKLSLTQVNF